MPRKPNILDEMNNTDLAETKPNKLYHSQVKAENNKEIADIVGQKMIMLAETRKRGKVNLKSVEDVEAVTMLYLESCRKKGNIPNFEGLSFALGYSRQHLYTIIRNRHDDVSVFLDNTRTLFADIIQTASSKRIIDCATSIFILKSMTGLGFTDRNDGIPDDINYRDEPEHDISYYRQKYKDMIGIQE